VATRSPKRTRLWKRLHALSCYTAEHTLLNYTVFFKGRVQCIQDWRQRHSKTTWIRWGSQGSIYPSPMWCWIRCRSAPDNREMEWNDLPRATGWGNASHITRLLPPASTYCLVQCRCEISLPLISITRLLPPATRYTRHITHVRRAALLHKLSYSWLQDFKIYTKTLLVCSSSLGGIYRPRSGVHGPSALTNQTWKRNQRSDRKQ
jgi:hypothetical protein